MERRDFIKLLAPVAAAVPITAAVLSPAGHHIEVFLRNPRVLMASWGPTEKRLQIGLNILHVIDQGETVRLVEVGRVTNPPTPEEGQRFYRQALEIGNRLTYGTRAVA
jgi:hypothetical protein